MLPILAFGLLLGWGCGDRSSPALEAPPAALEQRYDEVRAIHDEVMPQRANMVRLERAIHEGDLEADVAAFAKTRLERADDAMMEWMRTEESLNTLRKNMSDTDIEEYLNMREIQIRAVADSMHLSIAHAENVLAQ